jgi:sterol desaturase/sphingolipid hydroxylase (fatty acid hydroxylase superfamily)
MSAQALWTHFVESWPYGDQWLIVLCFSIGHSALTLPINFVALLMHLWPIKAVEERWKIQQEAYPSPRLVKEVIWHVLLNHFVTSPLFAYFVICPLFFFLDMPIREPIPSLARILFEFLIFGVVNDFLFYWTHRMFHSNPWIYKTFHARHHRFITPISWAAEYASIPETILANLIPTLAGPFIMKSHLFTTTAWLLFAITETLDAHSGFRLPFSIWRLFDPILLGPDGHDWHHSHNRGNYGLFKFWDWVCGTDIEYRKWLRGEPTTPFANDRSSPLVNKKAD